MGDKFVSKTELNIEDLKKRFPVQDVKPYGPCIIVPGTEFNPDWEGILDDKGYRCTNCDIGGKAVTLVCLKLEKGSTGEVYRPGPETKDPPASREKPSRKRRENLWDPKDEERLLKRWNEVKGTKTQRSEQLAPEFPGRTPYGLYMKHWALVRPNKKKKRQEPMAKDDKSPENTQDHTPTSTPAHAPNSTPKHEPIEPSPSSTPSASSTDSYVELVKLLKEIMAAHQVETLIHFDCYCPACNCPACKVKASVEDQINVWKCCPVCGGPLIVWNVEIGETSA
jgi:hypothetical protein